MWRMWTINSLSSMRAYIIFDISSRESQVAKPQVLYRERLRGCRYDRDERDPEGASICDTHIPLLLSPSPLLPPHLKSGLFLISPVPPLNPAQSRTNLRERGRAHHLMPPGFWEERQPVRGREIQWTSMLHSAALENRALRITYRRPNRPALT